MSSLLNPAVASLLDDLFRQAEETDKPLHEIFGDRNAVEREEYLRELLKDANAYRELYGKMKNHFIPVTPELGRLLYILACSRKAKLIVEFGMSFGISTIFLACAAKDCGGRVITTEMEPEKAERAKSNLRAAGVESFVEARVGDALETLQTVPGKVDLVFLDGAKNLYLPVLKLIEPQLAPGALVLTDNTLISSPYLEYVRNEKNGYLSVALPFESGSEISMRV